MAGSRSFPPEIPPDKTGWRRHYRLVSSQFPPISLFEDYVDAELMQAVFLVEARTNPRLRNQVGELSMVAKEDLLLGEGASPVMAAFTHIGRKSRFSDGSFGVYYAAKSIDTAIAEVKFHRARFLKFTNEPPMKLTLRSYVGRLQKPLLDIRDSGYKRYCSPDTKTYPRCHKFSAKMRAAKAWGLLYPSVRDGRGECAAFYRPPAVGIPKQGKHFAIFWDGKSISRVYELKEIKTPQ